jgi:mono/diheme cytochrome c family protein
MKRLLVVLCALPLFSLNAAACSDSDTSTGGTGDRTATILALTGDTAAGQTSFEQTCGLGAPSCHNMDGTAGTGSARDLTTDAVTMTDEFIVNTMLNGQGSMPPQDALDDQVIADIVAYVRASWGS